MKKNILLLTLSVICSFSAFTQIQLTGQVKDGSGSTIPGVNVIVKGSEYVGTITNWEGLYSLNVPENTDSIEFSFIGMDDVVVAYTGQQELNVVMKTSSIDIDEVVAIGYGTVKKRDISGSVASVKADVLESRPVLSVSEALTGKISGVNVTTGSGEPGSSSSIHIRGVTSLAGDSKPLYIIDGFPTEVNNVNPADIASIDVLKDAASTAIYGSRGANGVIIITTKQGAQGKVKVDFYSLSGVQLVSKKLDLLNNYEFSEKNKQFNFAYFPKENFDPTLYDPRAYLFFQDEEGNFYTSSTENPYLNPALYGDSAINTDWQDEMFQNALFHDYRLNLSGGGPESKYSVVLGYNSQDGILLNTNHEQYSGRLNTEFTLSPNVALFLNTAVNRRNMRGYAGASEGLHGVFYHTLTQPPIKPVDFGPEYILPGESTSANSVINPVAMANNILNDNKYFESINNLALKFSLHKSLVLNLRGGYYKGTHDLKQYFPSNMAGGIDNNGRSLIMSSNSERLNNENTLTYTPEFNSPLHALSLMVGNSLQRTASEWVTSQNSDFENEQLGYYGHGVGTEPLIPTITFIEGTLASFFGRLNYTLNDKYIFKATLRADGSSVFAKNNKWGYFPSAAFAYRINKESFMEPLSFIDDLKLRISWGETGKQAIGSYQSLARLGFSTVSVNGDDLSSISFPMSMANPSLKWETTSEIDLGMDAAFFDQRIQLVFDYYKRLTTDLLYNEPLPFYTGFSVGVRNIGELENSGYELSITGYPIRNSLVKWQISANASTNTTIINEFGRSPEEELALEGVNGNGHGIMIVGEKLGNWYGYQTDGIWQTQAEIDKARNEGLIALGEKVQPGYRKLVDQTGDGKITAEDKVIIGNGQPKWYGGFASSLSYKGFTLMASFNYSVGNDVYNYTKHILAEGETYANNLDVGRYQPTLYEWDALTQTRGDLYSEGNYSNAYPIAIGGKPQDNTLLDAYIEDASFLRLADVTLSYDLPKKIIKDMNLSIVSVFVSGKNLALWTNYSGFDPEVNSSKGSANYLLPGLDNFTYPKSRMFSGGVKVSF